MSTQYVHGVYGVNDTGGSAVSDEASSAIVMIGTAPVQTIALGAGESYPLNVPVLVRDIAEAKRRFGYSDDWDKYTLCEAMHHFFETKKVGPLVLINVLDPVTTHKSSTQGTKSLTPVNNRIVIADAQEIILDTVVVTSGSGQSAETKEKGVDYTIGYNSANKTITIIGITDLGSSALTITYYSVDPTTVTDAQVAGSTDGAGTNTGVYAVRNVYPMTGMIPAFLAAPGFSSHPTVHAAMLANSKQIGGHWDAYMFVDLPITANSTPLTLDTVLTWKNTNGYTNGNETVYFPMVKGKDGCCYHISTLAAANFLELLIENAGIPYHSASNTDCDIIESLYLGEAAAGKVFDDALINAKLNSNGIASAAFVGGRWAIWGAHSANYNQSDKDYVNVAETNVMMLQYLTNDFQVRRTRDVDKPLSKNDIESIVAEEQSRLDALKESSIILFGEAAISTDPLDGSDVYSGDYVFTFRVTTTPLAKSLKAIVTWVDDGFAIYYADREAETA